MENNKVIHLVTYCADIGDRSCEALEVVSQCFTDRQIYRYAGYAEDELDILDSLDSSSEELEEIFMEDYVTACERIYRTLCTVVKRKNKRVDTGDGEFYCIVTLSVATPKRLPAN